jgi:hypothetical protein
MGGDLHLFFKHASGSEAGYYRQQQLVAGYDSEVKMCLLSTGFHLKLVGCTWISFALH